MNRTIKDATVKDATVKRSYYESHDQLRRRRAAFVAAYHFARRRAAFVAAYHFARRLKTRKGLTPYAFICQQWTSEPERFRLNPLHQTPRPNI